MSNNITEEQLGKSPPNTAKFHEKLDGFQQQTIDRYTFTAVTLTSDLQTSNSNKLIFVSNCI